MRATEIFSPIFMSEQNKKQNKTFNNGSLGSGIDEERSEMRKVMWIAEFSESSNLWTHIAPSGIPEGMPVWVSLTSPFMDVEVCIAMLPRITRVQPLAVDNVLGFTTRCLTVILCGTESRLAFHAWHFQLLTSDQVGIRAELKHINKRRKRN